MFIMSVIELMIQAKKYTIVKRVTIGKVLPEDESK